MIIFGLRRTIATLAMLTLACRNGHVAAHRLVKATRWFTLFFIPLIPFSRKYLTVCAQCGTQVEWSKAEAEAAMQAPSQQVSAAVDPVAPPVAGTWSGGDTSSTYAPAEPAANTASAFPPPPGPPAGWYPDPAGGLGQRYWDGSAWTDQVHQG